MIKFLKRQIYDKLCYKGQLEWIRRRLNVFDLLDQMIMGVVCGVRRFGKCALKIGGIGDEVLLPNGLPTNGLRRKDDAMKICGRYPKLHLTKHY